MQSDEMASGFETLWKSQDEERLSMTVDEICARARAVERKSVREYWLVLAVLALFTFKVTLYMVVLSDPVIRIGLASSIAALLYVAVRWATTRIPRHDLSSSACAAFLRNAFEKKRENLLEIRCATFLLLPGMFAFWWRGGPAAITGKLGIGPSFYTQFQRSPVYLILFVLFLGTCWFILGKAARTLEQEIRRIQIK